GFLALAANVASVLLLMRYREGDANVRSVWLCSRNDAIGNVAVMGAAAAVAATGAAWPDLIVAGVMAGLFLASSFSVMRQAWAEIRGAGLSPVQVNDWTVSHLTNSNLPRQITHRATNRNC